MATLSSTGSEVREAPPAHPGPDRPASSEPLRSILDNSSLLIGAQVIASVLAMVLTVLVSRALGDAEFGRFTLALSLTTILGVPPVARPLGAFGKMQEASAGKDTTTGHWEMAGLQVDKGFPTFPNGFPAEMIARFEKLIGRGVLGNKPASGTTIIEEGFPSDSFLIVVRGRVDVRIDRGEGRASVGHLGRPASFGEVGLLLDEPRSATVVAETDGLVLRFGAVAFQDLFHTVPEFGLETARHLARRLREVSARLPLPESDVVKRPTADEQLTEEAPAPAPVIEQ